MHEPTDQDRSIETIEEMPAAPEADQSTRDADAPTWSAPTEGHHELPLTAGAGDAGTAADPAEDIPELISGERIEINQGSAGRIQGREITINQGGAAVISGDQVRVEQGGAAVIVGRHITLRESGAFLLLARRVDGDVTVAFDWRALTALFVGIVAIIVARGRR